MRAGCAEDQAEGDEGGAGGGAEGGGGPARRDEPVAVRIAICYFVPYIAV